MRFGWDPLCPLFRFLWHFEFRNRVRVFFAGARVKRNRQTDSGPASLEAQHAATVGILSYNVCLFGGKTLMSMFTFHDKERRNRIAEHLRSESYRTDIVCLQEIFSDGYRNFMVRTLKDEYPHALDVAAPSWGTSSGLLVLSKYPILDHRFVPYRKVSGLDRCAEKGVLCALLSVGEQTAVRLFTTHCSASGDAPMNVRQLRRVYREFHPEISPTLIAGDLNIESREVDHAIWDACLERCFPGYSDSFEAFQGEALATNTMIQHNYPNWPYPEPVTVCRILATDQDWEVVDQRVIRDWRLDGELSYLDCSDHLPIWASWRLREKVEG